MKPLVNASELNRLLLFHGQNDVTDFLRNSPLNRFLYKKLLGVLSASGIAVPAVKLFNEIYYQCARVNYDGMPGVDVGRRYWSEETFKQIDSIMPAIMKRDHPHQTFEFPHVTQFNNNPGTVVNEG